ncbi:unnamed protein product [Paramecium primaurelia]|uniref:Uncharacterized protein n=1 Tax=Paramecium primaurelia TaxID=5886 RepID=A0A8S1QNC2_PARPR|nr:unnamed protein product [Paramecium primaurelia]
MQKKVGPITDHRRWRERLFQFLYQQIKVDFQEEAFFCLQVNHEAYLQVEQNKWREFLKAFELHGNSQHTRNSFNVISQIGQFQARSRKKPTDDHDCYVIFS